MNMSNEEKEMRALVAAHQGEKDERSRLTKLKAMHAQTLSEIGSEDIEDSRVQQRARDAQLGITLCDARLAKLAVSPDVFDKVDGLLRVVEREYNESVMAARDAAFEALIASQLPFFDGDERACRDYWKRVNPRHPMLYKFEKAYRTHPTGPREHRDVVAEAASFLAKRERNLKLIGLD